MSAAKVEVEEALALAHSRMQEYIHENKTLKRQV